MPLDNQTFTIIRSTIQSSITPDYVGWGIGIVGVILAGIAIYITVRIYKTQTKMQREQKRFEDSLIQSSRKLIREIVNWDRHNILMQLNIVRRTKGSDHEKLETAKTLMKESMLMHTNVADTMMKEGDFIRSHITSNLYGEITEVVAHLRSFANPESLNFDFGGDSKTVINWLKIGDSLLEKMLNLAGKI